MHDQLRIATAEGERVFPLSQVRRVLRRRPGILHETEAKPKARQNQLLPPKIVDHAIGVELRKGELIWSWGSSDWYYNGEPAWGE